MKPYTYCVTHLPSGKRYYGVRFSKHCDPSDLWVKYFTSSEVIHDLIEKDGLEAFKTEVRRTFNSPKEAQIWEEKVLRRLNIAKNDMWLNRSIAGAILMTDDVKAKIREFNLTKREYKSGFKMSDETKKKMSEAKKGKISPNKGKKCPESAKLEKSKKLKGRSKPPGHREKLSAIAKTRYRINLEDGSWTWGYKKSSD